MKKPKSTAAKVTQLPNEPTSAETIAGELLQRSVSDFMEKVLPWLRSPSGSPPRLAYNVTVGTGKTSAIVRLVSKPMQYGYRIAIRVPTLELGRELLARLEADYPGAAALWYGREQEDPQSPGNAMCRRVVDVRAAQSVGGAPTDVCGSATRGYCPFHPERAGGTACGYLRQNFGRKQIVIFAGDAMLELAPRPGMKRSKGFSRYQSQVDRPDDLFEDLDDTQEHEGAASAESTEGKADKQPDFDLLILDETDPLSGLVGFEAPPISVRPEDHSAVLAAIECSDDREIIASFLESLYSASNDAGSDGYLPPLRPGEYYADLTFEQLSEWTNPTSAQGTRGDRDTPTDAENPVLIRSERDLHAFVVTMETVREVAKSNTPDPIGQAKFNKYSATQIRELNAATSEKRALMLNIRRICDIMLLGLKNDIAELRHLKVAGVEGEMFVRRKKLISAHYLKVAVMIFDATLRPDLLAHSFEQIDVSYTRRAKDGDGVTRYQLRDSDLPYSTLKGSDWPARLSVLAGLFERAYGRTGLIGPKFIREQVSKALPQGVACGHFGALKGLNSFEDVRVLVVTSRPAIAPIEAEDRAAVLTGQPIEAIPRDKRWYPSQNANVLWRDDPRAGWEMNSARHPDPIVEAVRASVTEDGLEQALGRSRSVRRRAENPLVEYLLTSTPTERPVDGTFTLGQLKAATSFVGVLLMSGIWFAGGSKGLGGVLHLVVQAVASQRPDSLYIHLIGNPAFEGPEPAADWLKKQRDDNPEIGLLFDDIDKALAQRAHTVGILYAPFPITDFQPVRAKVRSTRYYAQLYVRTVPGQTPADALRALLGPLADEVEIKAD